MNRDAGRSDAAAEPVGRTAKTVDEKAQAASALEGVLSRLLVVSENYPQLKADQNFPRFAGRARGHGEPRRGGAAAVQRNREDL